MPGEERIKSVTGIATSLDASRIAALVLAVFMYPFVSRRTPFLVFLAFFAVLAAITYRSLRNTSLGKRSATLIVGTVAAATLAVALTGQSSSPFVLFLVVALLSLPLTGMPALAGTTAAAVALATLALRPAGEGVSAASLPALAGVLAFSSLTAVAAVFVRSLLQVPAETTGSASSPIGATSAPATAGAADHATVSRDLPPGEREARHAGAGPLEEAIQLNRTLQSSRELTDHYRTLLGFVANLGFPPKGIVVDRKSETATAIWLANGSLETVDATAHFDPYFEPGAQLPDQITIDLSGEAVLFELMTNLPVVATYLPSLEEPEPTKYGLLKLVTDLFSYRVSELILAEKEHLLFSRFSSLYSVARTFSNTFDFKTVLESAAEAVKSLTGMQKAVALLTDANGDFDLESERAAVKGRKTEHPEEVWRAALLKVAREVANLNKPVVTTLGGGTSTLLCVPMTFGRSSYGVLAGLTSHAREEALADAKTMEVIAALVAIALSNLELLREREEIAVSSERDRIARDMHDSLIQTLFGLLLTVESSIHGINKDPAAAEEKLQRVKMGIQQAIKDAREYIYELYPQALTDLGLKAAIKRVVSSLGESTSAITLRVGNLPDSIPLAIENAILRVVQEAVSNAVRHSGASAIQVAVEALDGLVRVLVEDNGTGFVPSEVASSVRHGSHMGIQSMHERVRQVGGKLKIASAPGRGTRVEAVFALAGAAEGGSTRA